MIEIYLIEICNGEKSEPIKVSRRIEKWKLNRMRRYLEYVISKRQQYPVKVLFHYIEYTT